MKYLDFVDSIGYDQFKTYIEQYFDQVMALYRLCGTCDITSIGSEIHDNEITFQILFANSVDITTMEYVLSSDNTIDIYGTEFTVYSNTIDENTLQVTMSPCV